MSDPNVQTVVPEGVNTAIVVYGNTIDQVLEKLRKAEAHLSPIAERQRWLAEGETRERKLRA